MARTQTFSYSLLLALLVVTATRALAQIETRQDEQSKDKPLARIETIEAKIPVRAFDPLGKRVLNLAPKDVLVIENGAGRQVASLKLEPANILLVIDHSLEMGAHKNGRERPPDPDRYSPPPPLTSTGPNPWLSAPVSAEFAEQLIAGLSESDHIAMIQYSDKAELIQNWTTNGKEARAALRARFRQGHKTRLYDALRLAAETFQSAPAGRRVLVLLTDGADTASQISKDEAFAEALRAGATLYVVNWWDAVKAERDETKPRAVSGRGGTPSDTASARVSIDLSPWRFKRNKQFKEYSKKATAGAADLAQLAANSGGEVYPLERLEDLTGRSAGTLPGKILADIGAEYTLTYLTERRASETAPRDLEVMGAKSGLSVRARKKYYVGKEVKP